MKLVKQIRDAGFVEEADRIASVTPEDEARFDEWLSHPANKARWEKALASALNPPDSNGS